MSFNVNDSDPHVDGQTDFLIDNEFAVSYPKKNIWGRYFELLFIFINIYS